VIQEKSGSNWKKATMYQPNQQYRVRIRIKNRSKAGHPVGGVAFSHTGVYISSITIDLELNGAKFKNKKLNQEDMNDTRQWITTIQDFNDNIAPEKSRYFYIEFTWVPLIPVPVRNFPIAVSTFHREIMYIQPGPTTNININQ
jgi:hypothetical protein